MLRMLKRFAADGSGATAIEYGLIAALIAVLAIGGMTAFGADLRTMFGHTSDTASNAWNNAQIS